MKNVSESLAGRVGIVQLLGLSGSEIDSQPLVPFTTFPERLMSRLKQVKQILVSKEFSGILRNKMHNTFRRNTIAMMKFFR